ncbi:MAG TPA: SDR family oxidoreductase [Candidatus Dormibacteraeota bacterium]|jgi:short-subunit dehydrogenase|nr:SDR family oxidoreductase [Candidatus Dormibacteraeota bacterium]
MVLPAYVGALDRKRQRETALITGASSGIGLDLAQLMAPDFDLIITARNQSELEKIARELEASHGNHVHVIPADLSQPEAPEQLFSEIARRGLPVDVLINNAGFGLYGPFAESDPKASLAMVEVNIAALTALTRLALPGMIERKRGRIMNVASTAGFQPGPLMAVYYATKAYVIMFSEAIANELEGSGVSVTCFCPGATATKFAGRANMEESRLFKMGAMKSIEVAKAGYKGMMAGKGMVIPGLLNKTIAMSVRFSPRKLVTAISRSLQEKAK